MDSTGIEKVTTLRRELRAIQQQTRNAKANSKISGHIANPHLRNTDIDRALSSVVSRSLTAGAFCRANRHGVRNSFAVV